MNNIEIACGLPGTERYRKAPTPLGPNLVGYKEQIHSALDLKSACIDADCSYVETLVPVKRNPLNGVASPLKSTLATREETVSFISGGISSVSTSFHNHAGGGVFLVCTSSVGQSGVTNDAMALYSPHRCQGNHRSASPSSTLSAIAVFFRHV